MKTIGFIGGGRITRILLKGFANARVNFQKIYVHEINKEIAGSLKTDFPDIDISDNNGSRVSSCDWIFVALHPPVLMDTLNAVKTGIKKDALVVSLAPKITLEKLMTVLPDVTGIARMNPNAGTYVNKGYNPVCFTKNTDKKVIDEFISMFEKLGRVPVVEEKNIEAYAMISAMGHTYFWYQLQQLKELGLSYGLSENECRQTISEMLWGTTEVLFKSGLNYDKVVDLVPVKPMAEHENTIKGFYQACLNGIYQKIKP